MTTKKQGIKVTRAGLLLAMLILAVSSVHAVTVPVKYVGLVDLSIFDYSLITRSSFIRELCHEPNSATTVVQLNTTWYQYCGIPNDVIDDWLSASSMGRFYNQHIKGSVYPC